MADVCLSFPYLTVLRTALTTPTEKYVCEKSFNYSTARIKSSKNQRIFFAQDASTYFPEQNTKHSTYFSIFLRADHQKRDWKLIYFYALSTFQLKYICTKKSNSREFYHRNFSFAFVLETCRFGSWTIINYHSIRALLRLCTLLPLPLLFLNYFSFFFSFKNCRPKFYRF